MGVLIFLVASLRPEALSSAKWLATAVSAFWALPMALFCLILYCAWRARESANRKLHSLTEQLTATERDLAEAEERLDQHRSRLEHDLRGPIQFAMGYAALLAEGDAGPLNSQQLKYVENVRVGIDKVLEVARQKPIVQSGGSPFRDQTKLG